MLNAACCIRCLPRGVLQGFLLHSRWRALVSRHHESDGYKPASASHDDSCLPAPINSYVGHPWHPDADDTAAVAATSTAIWISQSSSGHYKARSSNGTSTVPKEPHQKAPLITIPDSNIISSLSISNQITLLTKFTGSSTLAQSNINTVKQIH